MPLPKYSATHVTSGHAALLAGITRQGVLWLCEHDRAPGAFFVTDGKGSGFWCIALDDSGAPILDRRQRVIAEVVVSSPTP
jgi:hypothetical protein